MPPANRMFRAAAGLVLPSSCAVCRRPGPPLCPVCADPLHGPARPHLPRPCPPGLPPLWATASYQGPARAALIAYKERGRRDLTAALARGLAHAVRAASTGTGPAGAGAGAGGGAGDRLVVLVPVPSGRGAARRRGGDHVRRLARAAAVQLDRPVLVCPLLRPARRLADLASVPAAQRAAARSGAFVAHAQCSAFCAERADEIVVIMVDDLVTSGYTLVEAATAVRRAGLVAHGAAVLLATQRRFGGDVGGLCSAPILG
ncbi:MAG: ComF family protein [Actinobacteria bacterium]|nr:ComF family protein [Actinomycetota bacterium]MBI3687822.1 ComF family protein [Actinomycetota bacterium]